MITIGLFTDSLHELPFEQMLDRCVAFGIESVEFGTGNFSGAPFCKIDQLLASDSERQEWLGAITARGLRVSALNCSGNLLDADDERRTRSQQVFTKTVQLAAKLNLDTVVLMSGCPGEPGVTQHFPNWVTTTWQPEYPQLLDRQWREIVIPYWREQSRFAADHGIRLAFEMHPGQAVYNPYTLLRLKEIGGDIVGANLDPSHLFWQGIDPVRVVQTLGDAIYHFHGKDCRIDADEMALNGGLETRVSGKRAWVHCLPGEGNPEPVWQELVKALGVAGYDRTLSIEYEFAPQGKDEGMERAIALLKRCRES